MTKTARDKSLELHKMFMTYKTRRRPVSDQVMGNVRVLDKQLKLLIDPERKEDVVDQVDLAKMPESKEKPDLEDADAGNTDGRPDGEKGK